MLSISINQEGLCGGVVTVKAIQDSILFFSSLFIVGLSDSDVLGLFQRSEIFILKFEV